MLSPRNLLAALLPFLALGVYPVCAAAQSVSGGIRDPTGAGVPDAQVLLLRADRTVAASATSDSSGRFHLRVAVPGRYLLAASKGGFARSESALVIRAGQDTADIDLTLRIEPVRSEVTVTAETGRVAEAREVAQSVNTVTRDQIDQRLSTVLADIAREEPGVEIQRTAPSMGGLAVRGLRGKHVAVYRDGVRYTTSAQRGGVSTFFNLNEAAGIETAEILRGPNSAQYGSDALGGVLHLISRTAEPGWHTEFSSAYTSAAHSYGTEWISSYGGERLGVSMNLAGRRVNTLRPAGGLDGHAAVTRFLGLPSSVLGSRLTDTAFTAYGGVLRAQFALTPFSRLTGHYERRQQDGGKRWDQLLGGDGDLVADLRNLMTDFGYLRFAGLPSGHGLDEFALTVSYNAQREERVNQGGNGNPLGSITHQYEKLRVLGTNFFASRKLSRHSILLGGDGYRELAAAPAFSVDPVRQTAVPVRPRIPDRARYLLYGLYLQDSWDLDASGRVRLGGAIRFGGISYRSRAVYSPSVNGRPLWPDDSAAANSVAGRLGAMWRVLDAVRVRAFYSRGFRAPSMTDLGTVGLQGNGFFEAAASDLTGRGATIGDRADERAVSSGRAVAQVRSETSDNYDLGVAYASRRFSADAVVFRMNLDNLISSQTLILPAGAEGQLLGDQPVSVQLPGGAVFVPAATAPVQVRGNLGAAVIRGFEGSFEAAVHRSLRFEQNLTWLSARDRRSGLPPDIEGGTPPLTVNLKLRWTPAQRRFWGEAYSQLVGRQERLSSLALADRRSGATRSRASIARFFNNGARVRGLVSNGILIPTGETLAQVQGRVLGDADSASLFPALPGYGIAGVRGGWQLSERSSVLVDFSNLLDKRHRGVSWGVDGPGRSVTVRYRYIR